VQNGANIDWAIAFYEIGAPAGLFSGGTVAGAATLGSVQSVDFNPLRVALTDVAVGHVSVEKAITGLFAVSAAVLQGYTGEQAHDRMARLAAENSVTVSLLGGGGESQPLGAQPSDTFVALLQEAGDSDGGILYEPRTSDDLTYRTLESMFSQTPAVTVAYTDNLLLPFLPTDDDQATRNRVTVTRAGGSSATVEDSTGPLSIQAPPAGVGVYDDEVTLSLATDAQCERQAGWRVHVGTHDEARWPIIGFDLAHPTFLADPALTRHLLSIDLGDRIDVTDVPGWLPPDAVSQLVQGMTETIAPDGYRVELNCTPARPYRVAVYGEPGDRWSNDSTTLAGTMTTTSTSRTVNVPAGALWTHTDGDFDILVAGERMTVTAVAGAASPQTLTVVRSVNAVVKTHAAGEQVTLADPVYYGL
jgi:hypothetical protein